VSEHEVRGAWFVAAREAVAEHFGSDGLEVLLAGLPAAHRAVVKDATAMDWQSEDALQSCLHSLRLQLAGGQRGRFGELLEQCTERGMGLVFSALVKLSPPRFVLSRVPDMWKAIRRGPGFVTVEHEEGSSVLRYQAFPYFADPIYQELTEHSVRALVRLCTSVDPSVTVERVTDDALDLRVDYRSR